MAPDSISWRTDRETSTRTVGEPTYLNRDPGEIANLVLGTTYCRSQRATHQLEYSTKSHFSNEYTAAELGQDSSSSIDASPSREPSAGRSSLGLLAIGRFCRDKIRVTR